MKYSPLGIALECAVLLRIAEFKRMGYIPDDIVSSLPKIADEIASHGDTLLYDKIRAKPYFNNIALAIAVLAFKPGGIKIFGTHYEASFLQP